MRLDVRKLYRNARMAMWRRHQYRSARDILKDFILRTTTQWYRGRRPPLNWALALRPRALPDPVYLRVGDSDFQAFDEVFAQSEYARVKQWGLPDDARILDLGANVGLASLYFATLFPKSGLVAVEPDDENCGLIEKNCRRLIDAGRLRVVRAFAAASDGVAGLDHSWQAWSFRKVDHVDAQHPAVKCLSIPTLLSDCGLDHVDLLKCDIEGSEREVFRDCSAWIGKVRHLIVETHNPYFDANNPYTVKHLFDDLRAAGWKFEVAFEEQERLVGIAFLKALP